MFDKLFPLKLRFLLLRKGLILSAAQDKLTENNIAVMETDN
jgi:hypothetical protein